METNILFLTNDLRDYIKNTFEKKNITTLAITFTLYQNINDFINKIKNFEITNKKNTLKNLFLHNVCSNKYNIEDKTEKINLFIKSLNELNNTLDTPIKIIKNDIIDIVKNSTNTNDSNICKNKINKLVNNYFESPNIKKIEIAEHDLIKKELIATTKEDKKLFMNFFEYIKCTDLKCEKYEITDENDPDGLLSLKKNSDNNIILLDLFKGENVQISMSVEKELILKKQKTEIKSLFDVEIKKICKFYANKFIKENFKNGKLIKNIKGGAGVYGDISSTMDGLASEIIINVLTKIFLYIIETFPILGQIYNTVNIFATTHILPIITSAGYYVYYCVAIASVMIYLYKYCNKLIDAYKAGEISELIKNFFYNITMGAATLLFRSIVQNIRNTPGYTKIYNNDGILLTNIKKNEKKMWLNNEYNIFGGSPCANKCYIIPNLKVDILNNFLLEINGGEFKECEKNKRIDIGNNNYIMSDDKILYCDDVKIVNKMDCLKKTTLFRNNKIINMDNVWDDFNKDLKKPINKQYKIIKKL